MKKMEVEEITQGLDFDQLVVQVAKTKIYRPLCLIGSMFQKDWALKIDTKNFAFEVKSLSSWLRGKIGFNGPISNKVKV